MIEIKKEDIITNTDHVFYYNPRSQIEKFK